MNNSISNTFDPIENLIVNDGLRIQAVIFHREQDMMLIVLNTKVVIIENLAFYPLLRKADEGLLQQYRLIASGIGIHWPLLNEDLSLKGLLENELRKITRCSYQCSSVE
jgi:hypothetical protein